MKKLWEFLCIVLLGLPMIVVGYFGTFLVFGLLTGHRIYLRLHRQEERDND